MHAIVDAATLHITTRPHDRADRHCIGGNDNTAGATLHQPSGNNDGGKSNGYDRRGHGAKRPEHAGEPWLAR
ncbi:MAG: hypothetical protein KBG15_10070 [Kofleriaceae bacterium]|nr:hypothetical protein [Kofleriaceae bacterium]